MTTFSRPAARALVLAVLSSLLVGCPGVRVGGQTVVPPVARPAVHAPRPAEAATLAAESRAGDGAATSPPSTTASYRDLPSGEGVIPADGQTSRGLGAPTVTTSAEVLAARAATGCHVGDHQPRIPPRTSVADPWLALDGDRPRVLPHKRVPYIWLGDNVREADVCDARHDHCLRDCTWLVTDKLPPYRVAPYLQELYADDTGFEKMNAEDDWQAFRTIPITRKNLEVGDLAAGWDRDASARQLVEVASIDWDAGTFRSAGDWPQEYPLAWSRVVVLRAVKGQPVEVMNGFTRETARVRPDELILPADARP